MTYKLICTDIDGTLLNKERELSKITISEVQRIAPIPFVLISSRMPKAMRHIQQQFNNTTTPIKTIPSAMMPAPSLLTLRIQVPLKTAVLRLTTACIH